MVKSVKTPETAPLRKSGKIISSFDEFKGVLTWNFTTGEKLEFDSGLGDPAMEATIPGIVRKAALHGFKQKISDAGAMSVDQTTGQPPAPEARIAKMRRVAESLASGQWELERTGGGGNGSSLLIRALAEKFSKPVDVIAPWIKAKTKSERDALAADKGVAKILARLTAESVASSGVDTAALLAELE